MSGENGTEEATLEPPYSDVEPWLRGVHSLVATSLMVVSILGNALVLWMVAKNKELQYRSILAGLGAVIVNILFSVSTNPQVLAGSVTGEWPFTQRGCVALGFVSTSIFYVRWMNALLIAVDRVLYITTPFFYQRNTKRILVVLTVLVWTLPFLSNAPSAVRGTYSYRSPLTFCAIECSEDSVCVLSYTIIFTSYLIIGMLCPTVIYIFLYCFGKKKRCDMRRVLGTHTHNDPPCTSNGHTCSEQYIPTSRPPGDLLSISEEGEAVPMEDLSPTDPLSNQTQFALTHTPGKTDKIIDSNMSQNGSVHFSTSLPLTLSSKLRSNSTPTHPKRYASSDSQQEASDDRETTTQARPPLPHCKADSSPPHHRRPSLIILSRMAMSTIVPVRQQVAIQLQERRAMITFAIIFTNLVITQIPLFFLSTTRRQSFFPDIPIWVHLIGVNLYFLAPALEPIIIMRNRDFKMVLSKMFRRRLSFSLSNSAMK